MCEFSATRARSNHEDEAAQRLRYIQTVKTAGTRRKTVLVWCSSVDPAGGMERVALSVANGLADRGWRVLMVGPFGGVPFLRRAIRAEIDFVDHRMKKSLAGVIQTARFLKRIVRENRVDVVSAHGSVFPLLFIAAPVVWTEHGVRYAGGAMLHGFRGFAWRRIRRLIEKGSWRLVTVSCHVQRQTCPKLKVSESRATVILNGLPNAEALQRLPPPEFKPPYRIGYLGRLIPSKRPMEVFELSRLLNNMGIAHVWKVFGDGVLFSKMREQAFRGTGHSVELCGVVEKPEEAFRQLDLLCFHSRGEDEGLGMVLVEAMAANRAIVAWDAGCIPEVLDGRGTLVPPPFSLWRFAVYIARTLEGGTPPRLPDHRWSQARMIEDYDAVLREADASFKRRKQAVGL